MTAKKIVLATLGAALVAGAAMPAFAAPDRPDRGPDGPRGPRHAMMQDVTFVRLLKNADTNKDGKISKEEMAAAGETLFTAIDGNKDGSITRGEILDYRIAKRDEFRKAHPDAQAEDDQDEDEDDDRPAPPPRAENDDRKGPPREHADREHRRHDGPREGRRHEARFERHGHGQMMGNRFFRMVDEDRDGKISKAEATAAGDKLFAFMDTNKDGTISIDDLPDRPL
jgi:Ca2+-binding EF-hand superfamily protein